MKTSSVRLGFFCGPFLTAKGTFLQFNIGRAGISHEAADPTSFRRHLMQSQDLPNFINYQ